MRSTYKAQRQSLEILVHHVNKQYSLTSIKERHITHTYIHTQIRTGVYMYAHAHMYTCMYIHTHMSSYVQTYTNVHTHHTKFHHRCLCLPCRMERNQLFQSFSAQRWLGPGFSFSPCTLGSGPRSCQRVRLRVILVREDTFIQLVVYSAGHLTGFLQRISSSP